MLRNKPGTRGEAVSKGLINVGPYLSRLRKMSALLLIKNRLEDLEGKADEETKKQLRELLDLIRKI